MILLKASVEGPPGTFPRAFSESLIGVPMICRKISRAFSPERVHTPHVSCRFFGVRLNELIEWVVFGTIHGISFRKVWRHNAMKWLPQLYLESPLSNNSVGIGCMSRRRCLTNAVYIPFAWQGLWCWRSVLAIGCLLAVGHALLYYPECQPPLAELLA